MPEPLTDQKIADFRQRLCEIATRQFSERGIDRVSMRSLATELGYSATALYSYFKNKEEILAATRAAAYDRLSSRLDAAMKSSADPWSQSRAIGNAYVDFAFGEPAAYKLAFALEQPPQALYPALDEAEARSRTYLTKYVENMVASGLLEGDPAVLAHVFWAAMHGIILLKMAGKLDTGKTSFETLRHETMRLITRGASPHTSGKRSTKQAASEQISLDL